MYRMVKSYAIFARPILKAARHNQGNGGSQLMGVVALLSDELES
jgi:hypothetical protein